MKNYKYIKLDNVNHGMLIPLLNSINYKIVNQSIRIPNSDYHLLSISGYFKK
jgi:hypothetical protein